MLPRAHLAKVLVVQLEWHTLESILIKQGRQKMDLGCVELFAPSHLVTSSHHFVPHVHVYKVS